MYFQSRLIGRAAAHLLIISLSHKRLLERLFANVGTFERRAWKQFGSLAEFLGQLWHQRQHLTPVFPHLLQVLQACGIKHGGFISMDLREWIHRYNLRCVPRPRNKMMFSRRHTAFLWHFLVDVRGATVCLGGFTTFYKAGTSFENLPLLFLLNLYLDFIYVQVFREYLKSKLTELNLCRFCSGSCCA